MHLEVANVLSVIESSWKQRRKVKRTRGVCELWRYPGNSMSTLRFLRIQKVFAWGGTQENTLWKSLRLSSKLHNASRVQSNLLGLKIWISLLHDKITHRFTKKEFWNESRVFHVARSSYLISFHCTSATKWKSEFLYTFDLHATILFSVCSLLETRFWSNPASVISHLCVNSRFVLLTTVVSPAHNSKEIPSVFIVSYNQRSPRITLKINKRKTIS